MTTRTPRNYWNHNGRHQKAYNSLNSALVPSSGACETVEGELLRAVSKIYYDAYNNGGGNNVSGPLCFLKEKLPGFKSEWFSAIEEPAHGNGGYSKADYGILEEMTDTTIRYVKSKNGKYTPNEDDMWNFSGRSREPEMDLEDSWSYRG